MPVVMVVEDNAITRRTMRRYLEAESLGVVEAPDGGTALAQVTAACPAVIIQDLHLPDMDGFTLLERLRAVPEVARYRSKAAGKNRVSVADANRGGR
jgi:CheY-like chemotaxis protein